MTHLDARLSKQLADFAQRTALGRKLADLCATHLIWFMGGGFALVVYYLSRAVVDAAAHRMIAGVTLAWMTTLALEYAVGRRRPFEAQGRRLSVGMLWVPPSFPSGHATMAFAMAASLGTLRDPWLSAIAYLLAVLVSVGRVCVRVHYLTDILAGATVGVVTVWALGVYA